MMKRESCIPPFTLLEMIYDLGDIHVRILMERVLGLPIKRGRVSIPRCLEHVPRSVFSGRNAKCKRCVRLIMPRWGFANRPSYVIGHEKDSRPFAQWIYFDHERGVYRDEVQMKLTWKRYPDGSWWLKDGEVIKRKSKFLSFCLCM